MDGQTDRQTIMQADRQIDRLISSNEYTYIYICVYIYICMCVYIYICLYLNLHTLSTYLVSTVRWCLNWSKHSNYLQFLIRPASNRNPRTFQIHILSSVRKVYMYIFTYTYSQCWTGRQAGRQTDRQTDRPTDR